MSNLSKVKGVYSNGNVLVNLSAAPYPFNSAIDHFRDLMNKRAVRYFQAFLFLSIHSTGSRLEAVVGGGLVVRLGGGNTSK